MDCDRPLNSDETLKYRGAGVEMSSNLGDGGFWPKTLSKYDRVAQRKVRAGAFSPPALHLPALSMPLNATRIKNKHAHSLLSTLPCDERGTPFYLHQLIPILS